MGQTHITDLKGRYVVLTSDPTRPEDGEMYFNRVKGQLCVYDATNKRWLCRSYTSTSTSTTTTTSTSSSTSTTSTSSSTSSSTSTSTTTTV